MSSAGYAAGLAVGIAFVVAFSIVPFPYGARGEYQDVTITLERTVCFGACPDYLVTIHGDGTVEYEGRNFVAVQGIQTAHISDESVKRLVDEFYRAGFFSLQDRYEQSVTDLPSQTTSITIDGKTKTVYRYGFEPQRLAELEDRIDEVAGTEKWVKG